MMLLFTQCGKNASGVNLRKTRSLVLDNVVKLACPLDIHLEMLSSTQIQVLVLGKLYCRARR